MSNRIHTITPEEAMEFVMDATWGIAKVLPDGTFDWLNPAFCRILEAPAELIVGTKFSQWTYPDDLEIDVELARQVRDGEIPCYTLTKRYVKRLSTPQNPRIVCGMLSVWGKWQEKTFSHYRVQFQPYESIATKQRINLAESAKWLTTNWKTITTVLAVLASLIWTSSGTLLDRIQQAKQAADSVNGVLSPSSPGQQPQQPSQ
jgi:PAS domain-containing protein